jgi:hypothetical protein
MKHVAIVLLGLLAGCPKSEDGASGSSSASASASVAASAPASASVAASASAPASASVAASASAADSASAAATQAPPSTATAKATTVASGGAAPACGTKPLPDCPLQKWMKDNTNVAMAASDFDALNKALEKTATFAPAGYANWASISKDGARAARQADLAAVKASCRGCHDQYKKKYKDEIRTRPISG